MVLTQIMSRLRARNHPYFSVYVLIREYFYGENGDGLGASVEADSADWEGSGFLLERLFRYM